MRKITFKMTSSACPEQYDAYLNGEKVGYLRLRHGHFTVEAPECGGYTVYEAVTHGDGDFYDQEERDYHLRFAAQALLKFKDEGPPKPGRPPAPDIEYGLEDFAPWATD